MALMIIAKPHSFKLPLISFVKSAKPPNSVTETIDLSTMILNTPKLFWGSFHRTFPVPKENMEIS